MSGEILCDQRAIWECPFCGKPTWKIELPSAWGTFSDGTPCYDDAITKYEDGLEVKELILRIECEDKQKQNSALYECPAMSAMGAYHLHIYPDGSYFARYY